ncbi:hypothetical protein SEVIR_1G086300v4 [Setaria viridis]|uniref:Uncharacterized protein n=2 Tax=Setaria TaxID=4554 RepID=A0A368PJ15_SETIT|nr:hypothetical protein SETIT_1G088200v2 [Setaria italica]TKW37997.1 hypothetical protein SEVIR_1G086300v2 [Setaria viridis]
MNKLQHSHPKFCQIVQGDNSEDEHRHDPEYVQILTPKKCHRGGPRFVGAAKAQRDAARRAPTARLQAWSTDCQAPIDPRALPVNVAGRLAHSYGHVQRPASELHEIITQLLRCLSASESHRVIHVSRRIYHSSLKQRSR